MPNVCPECGTLNPRAHRFCSQCGAPLTGVAWDAEAPAAEETAPLAPRKPPAVHVPPPVPPGAPAPPVEEPEGAKRGGGRWWLAIVAAVVALCICGAIALAAIGWLGTGGGAAPTQPIAARTEEAAPTETLMAPTETTAPTATPVPTKTPVPPTKTPESTATPEPTDTLRPPTDTPRPTPTSSSGSPREVQLYALEVAEKLETIGEELLAVGEMLMEPRFADEDWMVEIARHMAKIQSTHEELQDMDLPSEMAAFHERLLDATQDCFDAMDYAGSGIRNLNVADLGKAAELMTSCGTKVAELPEVLEGYMEQFE